MKLAHRFHSRSNRFYSGILLSLTIVVIVVVLILSWALSSNFERISLSLVHDYAQNNLIAASHSLSTMSDSAKALALQAYFDSSIRTLLFYTNLDQLEITVGIQRLQSYANTSPLVQSIYALNPKSGMFYTSLSNHGQEKSTFFFDQSILNILSDSKTYPSQSLIPRTIPDPNSGMDPQSTLPVYTYIFYEAGMNSNGLGRAIVINIKPEWVRKIIESMNSISSENDIFIIDSKGIVVNDNQNGMLNDVSDRPYIRRIIDSTEASGYFFADIDGVKSLVNFTDADFYGWKFVATSPYQKIIEKITAMQRNTLFIALGILLISLLISVALSRRLNKPIQAIVSKLKSMETEKSDRAYEVKQELLRSLLQGNEGDSGDSIRLRLSESGVKLDVNGVLLVLLFKVDRFDQFCSRYNYKDRALFKYCVLNIASELISQHFTNEGVDMENDTIVYILNPSGCPDELLETRLYEMLEGIQTNVEKYLEFTLSVVISPVFTGISDLPEQYSTAKYAMNSRVFFGHSAVIHSDRISQSGTKTYTYPQNKEKMMFDALRLGKLQEAESAYLDIIHSLSGFSYNVFQSSITHLAILIGTTFDSADKSSGEPMIYDLSRLISDVNRMETLEEINEAFRGVFRTIIERMEDRRSSKHEHLVKDIMILIKKKYIDTNLSVETIADSMGLSPVYLSRLFKRLTGDSVADHINGIRMEKAKELLLKSDLSVNEIMEKTGFLSNGYFYTQFKKLHGVTPSQFRQQALRRNDGI